MNIRIPLLTLLALLIVPPFQAEAKTHATKKKSATASTAASATSTTAKSEPSGKSELVWDAWYTVTVSKTRHYAYYNDRVELRQGRIFFQNHFWKSEEGYINEEQLGAFAEDSPELKPLFFNFHSAYRATETSIDGTVQDNTRLLTVKARKGGQDLPLIKRTIPDHVMLSVFFPVWLGQKLKTMKEGQSFGFMSILEDNLDLAFSPVNGRIRWDKPDEFAKKNGLKKIAVNFRDMDSTWYVDDKGTPLRIDMPAMKAVIERATKDAAEKFLSTDPAKAEPTE